MEQRTSRVMAWLRGRDSACWRSRLVSVAAIGGALAFAPVGCAAGPDDDHGHSHERGTQPDGEANQWRMAGPREMLTLFSPLDLPTPTEARLASGVPGPAYWQNRADMTIDVTLDTDQRRISALQVIVYTNNSPHELDYIWLHLEQNLFNSSSRGARMAKPEDRFGFTEGFEGGFEISNVRVALADGGLTDGSIRVHDTLGRIDLPAPLQPGESVTIGLDWAFNIPPYGADRMGIEEVEQGTIFQIAQWFPTPVKYDDVDGWATMPYLGTGEFYTEFGDYEVNITVPGSMIVGATGELTNPREVLTLRQLSRWEKARQTSETTFIVAPDEVGKQGNRPTEMLTWRFRAENVRAFAFTASDAFIWDAAAVKGSNYGTMVYSLYPKEAQPLWERSTDMMRASIEGYNARWLEYPYPVSINANGIVGGMEYPMLSFCRERRNENGLFGVTTHELGHNWFPMIINTNERRHAWMDEGFCSFINIYSFREYFPGRAYRRGDVTVFAQSQLERVGRDQPVVTPPDQIHPGMLGYTQYSKPAIGLYMLREHVLGHERFDFAFNRYMAKWAFKSPTPADFFRCMEDAAGEDLAWFWRGWFYETGLIDQALVGVERERSSGEDTEFFQITIRNNGEMAMPVAMRIELVDGTKMDLRTPVAAWHASNEWVQRVNTGGVAIQRVTLDPDLTIADVDRSNNVWERGFGVKGQVTAGQTRE